jgi:lipoic acid synthetase
MSEKNVKPAWLKRRISNSGEVEATAALLQRLGLHSVCQGAACPNIGECFGNKTVTFMIMGDVCTRNCRFCAVTKGAVKPLDLEEPERLGQAAAELGLAHVVITSVTRDDLADGGAAHFAAVVKAVHRAAPATTVELLIPDLCGDWKALGTILEAGPDILNHNLETVESLYAEVRPQARYDRSLELLRQVKLQSSGIFTKSGIMVGLGEEEEQIFSLMDDLRKVDCDILTVGQYLRPTKEQRELTAYITPEQFNRYETEAYRRGFRFVASGPFVRSSYHAREGMTVMKKPSP